MFSLLSSLPRVTSPHIRTQSWGDVSQAFLVLHKGIQWPLPEHPTCEQRHSAFTHWAFVRDSLQKAGKANCRQTEQAADLPTEAVYGSDRRCWLGRAILVAEG